MIVIEILLGIAAVVPFAGVVVSFIRGDGEGVVGYGKCFILALGFLGLLLK